MHGECVAKRKICEKEETCLRNYKMFSGKIERLGKGGRWRWRGDVVRVGASECEAE